MRQRGMIEAHQQFRFGCQDTSIFNIGVNYLFEGILLLPGTYIAYLIDGAETASTQYSLDDVMLSVRVLHNRPDWQDHLILNHKSPRNLYFYSIDTDPSIMRKLTRDEFCFFLSIDDTRSSKIIKGK